MNSTAAFYMFAIAALAAVFASLFLAAHRQGQAQGQARTRKAFNTATLDLLNHGVQLQSLADRKTVAALVPVGADYHVVASDEFAVVITEAQHEIARTKRIAQDRGEA